MSIFNVWEIYSIVFLYVKKKKVSSSLRHEFFHKKEEDKKKENDWMNYSKFQMNLFRIKIGDRLLVIPINIIL